MFKAVKAKAYLRGNDYVTPVDIALCIKDVLRHRIILSYEALALDKTADDIIQTILEKLPVP
jgi:MoxR-like ATPase